MFRTLSTLVAVGLTCSFANAMPFFWAAHHNVAPNPGDCTNFSGDFQGACKDKEGREQAKNKFTIQQNGCESVEIKGHDIPLGALVSGSVAVPGFKGKPARAAAGTLTLGWDKDKRDLLVTASGSALDLGVDRTMKTKAMDGALRLEGNKLILDLKDQEGRSLLSCEYVKQ